MQTIWTVVTNNSDGTVVNQWVNSQAVLDVIQALVDGGDPTYSVGGKLVTTPLAFPDDMDMDAWAALNNLEWVVL